MRGLIVVTGVVLGFASSARADGGRMINLEYRGDVCDAALVRKRVTALVHRDPFTSDAAKLVSVAVEPGPEGVRGTVSIGEGGRRVLDAASCDALADELGFVIAMVLAAPEVVPETSSADSKTSEDLDPSEIRTIGVPVIPRTPTRGWFDVLAGAAMSTEQQLTGLLGARIRGQRLSLALELGLGRAEVVEIGGGQVRISRHTATLASCAHAGPLAGCATAVAGWIHGSGEGLAVSATATSPFAALGVRMAVEHELTAHFAVRAELDLRVPLTTNRLMVDDMPVWTTGRAEAWLGLGVAARIP